MSQTLTEIKSENLETELFNAKGIVLADFWAEWCGPCRAFAPAFSKIAEDFTGKLHFAKVNVDEVPEAAERLGISGIPTSIFFKDGKEIKRIVGAISKDRLETEINHVLRTQ